MASKSASKIDRLIAAATKAGMRADFAKRRARIAKSRLKLVRKAAKVAKKAAKQARKLVADAKSKLAAARMRRRARSKRPKPKPVKAKSAVPNKRKAQRKHPKRASGATSPAAIARSVINRLDAVAHESAPTVSPQAKALPPVQGGGGNSVP